MNISDLTPAEYNSDIRQLSDVAKDGLEASMREFGDIAGITFNQRTKRLVTGHQRVARLKARYGDLSVIDGQITTPDGHIFPVRFVDWDDATERLANVTANNPEIAGVFTVKLPDFIGALPTTPVNNALRLHELVQSIKLPDNFVAPAPPAQQEPPNIGKINLPDNEYHDFKHKTQPSVSGGDARHGDSWGARDLPAPDEYETEDDDPPFNDSDYAGNDQQDGQQDNDDNDDSAAPQPEEKPDKSIKYPVFFQFSKKTDFERWKTLRKKLKLKDTELALHLLDISEAMDGSNDDMPNNEEIES